MIKIKRIIMVCTIFGASYSFGMETNSAARDQKMLALVARLNQIDFQKNCRTGIEDAQRAYDAQAHADTSATTQSRKSLAKLCNIIETLERAKEFYEEISAAYPADERQSPEESLADAPSAPSEAMSETEVPSSTASYSDYFWGLLGYAPTPTQK